MKTNQTPVKMSKYSVIIPAPSAKRLAANAELIIRYHHGINPHDDRLIQYDEKASIKKFKLDPNAKGFEFEVEEKYQWIYSGLVVDGFSFEVYITYANLVKTREETKNLVPEVNHPS